LHDFNTRNKNQLHFPSVKFTSLQKVVTYSAIKIFNNLPSNVQELQESKRLVKSALRKYLLAHVCYSVEEFLIYNNGTN